MHSLHQLRSGELKGIKTLKLSCELTQFPNEIFELAESLEILDLSNNQLSQLPENFSELKQLKIAFFSDNLFTEFPKVLSECPNLTMIGFKANQIKTVPENAFPSKLQWLILTNNCIEQLPKSIGQCLLLQKVALAGNKLKSLPEEMSNCKNLELLRISVNQFSELPKWLLSLPRLSWLAYSGNPCSKINDNTSQLPLISWTNLIIKEQLGEGASGIISKAEWRNETKQIEVAVKVFKGEVTSDGLPEDEMNICIEAGKHQCLVPVLGKIEHHPNQKQGLVFELIPPNFTNLGGPPSYATCTRDVFKPNTQFSLSSILKISQSIAEASLHLHHREIMHGDLYAHNILIDENIQTIFGDFGAATPYLHQKNLGLDIERIEVRAFGCLLEDLLNHNNNHSENANLKNTLISLKNDCMNGLINERPNFTVISERLKALSS